MAEKTEGKKKGFTIKIPKINPWMVSTVILAGVLAFVLAGGWTITGQVVSPDGSIMSAEDAANRAIDFVNNNLVQPGTSVSLVSVEETSGVYKVISSYQDQEIPLHVTKDGKYMYLPQATVDLEETPEAPEQPPQPESTIGDFLVSDEPVCEEDGKPIIYFFGSERCPHCRWEHPVVENVTANFEDYISFHNNMDTEDDRDVFYKYNPRGTIPTLVFGCKYYRVGSGGSRGEEQEKKVLTALICKLTNDQPTDVCAEVEDLVEQV